MMHPPQGLGASIPPTVPLLSTAALLGSASTLSEPYYQYSRFGKKPGMCHQPLPCPSSLGGTHTCALTSQVFTCAVPRGACGRTGNGGMEGRAGDWEGQRAPPETARYADPGPPLRTGAGALTQYAQGAELSSIESGSGEGRGEQASGGRGWLGGTSAGGGAQGIGSGPAPPPRRPALSSSGSTPLIPGRDSRPWRTTRVSQEGGGQLLFPLLRLCLRIFKSQEHKHIHTSNSGPNSQILSKNSNSPRCLPTRM
ncbi:uncharacterized protein LOC105075346 isoform X1 [Camelus bactrianus]|uniref:Uncharacterized protein LOC105075346 isoform X1 n=1 Tax=Camelus bactrianus TaxID=9837 RepID=A0AC58R775_CAMBA